MLVFRMNHSVTRMLRVVIFWGLLALARCQSTAVNQCLWHQAPLPINTYIVGCINPPCQLPSLSHVEFHMIFQAPHTMRSMRTLATAYLVPSFPIGYPHGLGDDAVTCNFLTNSYCPVLKDEVIQYTLVMYMEPTFPTGAAVTIEFRIVDEATNSPVVCIRVPIVIAQPLSTKSIAGNNSTISP